MGLWCLLVHNAADHLQAVKPSRTQCPLRSTPKVVPVRWIRLVRRRHETSTLEIQFYGISTANVDHASVTDVQTRPPAMPAGGLHGEFLELAAKKHSRGLSWTERAVSDINAIDHYEEVISRGAPLGASRYVKLIITHGRDVRIGG